MKNITLKIDDDTYNNARIRAAQVGTSVSAVVRDYLITFASSAEKDAHSRRVAALKRLYAKANARAKPRKSPLTSLTRDEIYSERLR